MKKLTALLTFVLCSFTLCAQGKDFSLDTTSIKCGRGVISLKPRPFTAAAYTFAIDGLVWTYDRFITKSEFAKINFKTAKKNLETGFVWDSDRLATNHLGHPYNGGLYFMGARSCGLNYWQSLPYAAAGSLLWELFAEKEPPGLNDVIATPIAGALFGETFYRTSTFFLDDSKTGLERITRELGAAVFNPAGFVDRLLTGKLWYVDPEAALYYNSRAPLNASITVGGRFLSDGGGSLSGGSSYPAIRIGLEYGDPFDTCENTPFDYFKADASIFAGSGTAQPTFGAVNITGRLWGKELDTEDANSSAIFGIWQQYDYYHNRHANKEEPHPLFNLSETVAAGPGIMFRQEGGQGSFQQGLFADIIALGAVENDNIFIIERHYNMGSGFALKSASALDWKGLIRLSLQAKLFYLNTWGDYTAAARAKVEAQELDPLYTNTMGDKGHSWAFVIAPELDVYITRNWGVSVSVIRLGRDSFYKSYPSAKARTTELHFGIKYKL